MTDLVFFYGTLMSGFQAARAGAARSRTEARGTRLDSRPRCSISASIRPPFRPDSRVRGEVYRMLDRRRSSTRWTRSKGYRPGEPDASLYTRVETPVTFDDGHVAARGCTSTTRRSAAPADRVRRLPRTPQVKMQVSAIAGRGFEQRCAVPALHLNLRRSNPDRDERDHRDTVRRLDEFDAGAVEDDFLVDVGNAAVGDASFDDDRSVAERQAEFVKGVELEGKAGFDLAPPRLISLIAIGWNTMTSPCSSPRIWMRSSSRLSSGPGRGARPSGRRLYHPSIHPDRRLRREHLALGRFSLPPSGSSPSYSVV